MDQANRLYVGNLPYDIVEDKDLAQIFVDLGFKPSRPRIIKDRETGRSKGFGFVEVPPETVQDAIQAADQMIVAGRPLSVSVAKPRENTSTGGVWGAEGNGSRAPSGCGGGNPHHNGGGGGGQDRGGRGGRDRDRDRDRGGRW